MSGHRSASTAVETPANSPELVHDRVTAPQPTAGARRWAWLTPVLQREIILILLLILCYGFFRQVAVWNEFSRYDLVVALVDDRTTRIDPYHQNTGDKAFYNGHYYSDKAPGTAFLGVPAYVALKVASNLTGSGKPSPDQVVQALAFTVSGIPTVLLVLLLLRFLRPVAGEPWALTIALGYGLGTIAFPFATMFFGHAASAFFLFAAFYVLWRYHTTTPGTRHWLPVLAGFLAGWAVLVEISALLGVLALLLYALSYTPPQSKLPLPPRLQTPLLMIAGAIPPALLLFGYNWASFGGPFNLSYANLANRGFAEGMGRGILGVTAPRLKVLNDILLGPRGLLILAPWLALAPLGLLAARQRETRREVLLSGAIVAAFLVFNAGYYLPFGGWTPGPRFLSPALPFAAILVALAPRAFRPLVGLQIAFSIVVFLIATTTMPNAPEAARSPLGDLWLPRLLARDLAQTNAWLRWGLHGIQPLFILGIALGFAAIALFATTQTSAAARRLSGALIGVLLVLVLGFGTPLDLAGVLNLNPRAALSADTIAIVDAGVTPTVDAEGKLKAAPWAQIENYGEALTGTRVVFTVYNPSGAQVWSAWHGNVNWRAGERKRLGVEWKPGDAARGSYRVGVTIMSENQQTVYVSVENAGTVRVR